MPARDSCPLFLSFAPLKPAMPRKRRSPDALASPHLFRLPCSAGVLRLYTINLCTFRHLWLSGDCFVTVWDTFAGVLGVFNDFGIPVLYYFSGVGRESGYGVNFPGNIVFDIAGVAVC